MQPGVAAFDASADAYDDVAGSALGRELRARVHAQLRPLIESTTNVLDLGCGTGLDLERVLSLGPRSAVGVDVSGSMLALARRRVPDAMLHRHDLASGLGDQAMDRGPFDVVYSNFGVWNCIPDPGALVADLRRVTTADAHLVVVVMGRRCPADWLALLARRGGRRRSGGPVRGDGAATDVFYRSPDELAAQLAPAFTLRSVRGLGWALPTFEHRRLLEARPRILRSLAALDAAGAPLAGRFGIGDHYTATFVRSSS